MILSNGKLDLEETLTSSSLVAYDLWLLAYRVLKG